jgi:hypothetical protein
MCVFARIFVLSPIGRIGSASPVKFGKLPRDLRDSGNVLRFVRGLRHALLPIGKTIIGFAESLP